MTKDALEKLIESVVDWSRAYQHALDQGPESEAVACEAELKSAKAELLAALTGSERPEVDLHKEIMNIQVDEDRMIEAIKGSFYRKAHTWEHLYNVAFRDARHAAAGIVAGRWRKVEP